MARQTSVNAGYTILDGAGTGINGQRIDVWAEYLLGQSDVAANCTPITVYFYTALNSAYTSATQRSTGLDSALQVGGQAGVGVENGAYNFTSPDNIHLLGSYSGNVVHNNDGTGSVTISGSFTTASSYISGGTVTGQVVLPTIARETTLGATDAAIGQTSVIALSVKSPEYAHSVAYQFGQLTGYITADGQLSGQESVFTAAGVPFAVPEEFYYEIPDAAAGICTLTCRTYRGDTLIGHPQTATFTAYAQESQCLPLVTVRVEDVNAATVALTGDAKRLVCNGSIARCHVTAQAQKGAAVASITVAGQTLTGDYVDIPCTQAAIPVVVTDSRGFTTQTADETVALLDYIPVSNLASVSRDDPTAHTAPLVFSGSFWNGHFGAAENSLLLQYRIGTEDWITARPELTLSEGRYAASIQLSGLDYTQSHSLQVRVSDALSAVEKALTVQKGIPVFDWGETDFVFHVPVSAPALSSPVLTEILERLNTLEEKINGSD